MPETRRLHGRWGHGRPPDRTLTVNAPYRTLTHPLHDLRLPDTWLTNGFPYPWHRLSLLAEMLSFEKHQPQNLRPTHGPHQHRPFSSFKTEQAFHKAFHDGRLPKGCETRLPYPSQAQSRCKSPSDGGTGRLGLHWPVPCHTTLSHNHVSTTQ